MSEYVKFGKEWEAELMRWTKKQIIDEVRNVCLAKIALSEKVEELELKLRNKELPKITLGESK